MFVPFPITLQASRHLPLGAAVAALLGLAAPSAYATSVTVLSCTDGGVSDVSVNLRNSIAAAGEGYFIDMSALVCPDSKITLQQGEIPILQDSLHIQGPGVNALSIESASGLANRIFKHTGHSVPGAFTIKDVSIRNGIVNRVAADAKGGCIYSKGRLYLTHAAVTGCAAYAYYAKARGGGVYAQGHIGLTYAVIANNTAYAYGGSNAEGGGTFTFDMSVQHSTISGNGAVTRSGGNGDAGGLRAFGSVNIVASTIAGNLASHAYGGALIKDAVGVTMIVNSTISGNSADTVGGMYTMQPSHLINSTIAFNQAQTGGIAAGFAQGSQPIELQSTLIANNGYGPSATQYDLSAKGTVASGSSDNLVRDPRFTPLPTAQGNIVGSCPLLAPLRFNGGPTPTHALLSTSPAINQGNNTLGAGDDQRGYARVSPINGSPDIGAYEVQQDDIVFNAGFDGCPAL